MSEKSSKPSKTHDLSFQEPDYSGPSMASKPGGKEKKQKMKTAYPNLVIKDNPHVHKQMEVGKKYRAHVILSPTVKKQQEGQTHSYEPEGSHMECNVHSIGGIEPHEDDGDGADSEGAQDQAADFGTLGKK